MTNCPKMTKATENKGVKSEAPSHGTKVEAQRLRRPHLFGSTACWSADARSASALPEPRAGLGRLRPYVCSVQDGCRPVQLPGRAVSARPQPLRQRRGAAISSLVG